MRENRKKILFWVHECFREYIGAGGKPEREVRKGFAKGAEVFRSDILSIVNLPRVGWFSNKSIWFCYFQHISLAVDISDPDTVISGEMFPQTGDDHIHAPAVEIIIASPDLFQRCFTIQ